MILPIDLLGIAAHPDDVELACAGTMILAKRQGRRTGVVDMTRGELSTRGTLASRSKETDLASEIMGLDHRSNLGMPDGNIELSQENLLRVIREIRTLRPTIILAPAKVERHPDHEAAAELARRAAFYAGLAKIETTAADGTPQAPHRPLMVLHFMQTYSFPPSVIVDVSPVIDDKMRAIEAYATQVTGSDKSAPQTLLSQPGFISSLRARAVTYGAMIGCEYGEAFWSVEPVGTKDLFSLVTKTIA